MDTQAVTASDIVVMPDAFKFLRLQKGKLEPLAHDEDAWRIAYHQSLDKDYADLKPHLPKQCVSVLDIGSGLGGIDIMLSRHYGGHLHVNLMDGAKDKPRMELHRKTFNDMAIAQAFLADNGVHTVSCIDANMNPVPNLSLKPELVISLGAWCFHLGPLLYLNWVQQNIAPNGTLIVDVRNDKADWMAQLNNAFEFKAVARSSKKFERLVYVAK